MHLRIGHLSTFYHTAMLLMADRSLCSGINAEIEWKLFGTGPAIVKAFEDKELDLAYIGLPPAIIGMERGVDIVCIAGGHMEGTVFCSGPKFRGYPELKTLSEVLAQFRGMTIGVPGNGSIHDVILKDSIAKAGLSEKILVKNFPWADMALEAIAKDEVAAAFGTPALGIAVRHYAGGRIIWPPSMLWPNNPSYGIVVGRQFLESCPLLCEQFLSAHETASSLIRTDPVRAATTIAAHVGFIDHAFVHETLIVSPRYCAQLTDDFIDCTMDFVKVMQELGFIRRQITPAEIFDRTYIDKIHPEPAHYKGEYNVRK